MYLSLLIIVALRIFIISVESQVRERVASLIVLPPIVLGYDELYDELTKSPTSKTTTKKKALLRKPSERIENYIRRMNLPLDQLIAYADPTAAKEDAIIIPKQRLVLESSKKENINIKSTDINDTTPVKNKSQTNINKANSYEENNGQIPIQNAIDQYTDANKFPTENIKIRAFKDIRLSEHDSQAKTNKEISEHSSQAKTNKETSKHNSHVKTKNEKSVEESTTERLIRKNIDSYKPEQKLASGSIYMKDPKDETLKELFENDSQANGFKDSSSEKLIRNAIDKYVNARKVVNNWINENKDKINGHSNERRIVASKKLMEGGASDEPKSEGKEDETSGDARNDEESKRAVSQNPIMREEVTTGPQKSRRIPLAGNGVITDPQSGDVLNFQGKFVLPDKLFDCPCAKSKLL